MYWPVWLSFTVSLQGAGGLELFLIIFMNAKIIFFIFISSESSIWDGFFESSKIRKRKKCKLGVFPPVGADKLCYFCSKMEV